MSLILNQDEIKSLKKCGSILSSALQETIDYLKPGVSGLSLDKVAETAIRRMGATPSFLNYGDAKNPYPATICLSINNEVVHGIPSKEKIIREGDVVSIDIGARYNGICTDMAKSVIVGKAKNNSDPKLLKVTQDSLNRAIAILAPGVFTGDIGYEVQSYVEKNGMSVVKSLVGHGIGRNPHQEPQIPNFGKKRTGFKLLPGIAIAIEPMVNAGAGDVITASDGWTVKTYDGSNSAHFEHTILITDKKPIVITA
ncbi:MAG: Methionine aminopeptidase 1 [bacterium ADurb.Bin212]|nr:MAG: Methionine aminopeptidase 1 [bacterium ADurb.Bin212]